MADTIQEYARDNGTRKVFCGHSEDDVYLAFGRHWGPGVVEVPNNIADHLEPQIKRVQLDRPESNRIDPTQTDTPRNVNLNEATDLELEAILAQRRRQREIEAASGQVNPLDPPIMTAEEVGKQSQEAAGSRAAALADATKATAKMNADNAASKKADEDAKAKLMQQAFANQTSNTASPAPTATTPPPTI